MVQVGLKDGAHHFRYRLSELVESRRSRRPIVRLPIIRLIVLAVSGIRRARRETDAIWNVISTGRSCIVPKSVLDAIKMGFWDFEPPLVDSDHFDRADAMPGTKDKLSVLAERVKNGLPLWHPQDRDELDEPVHHVDKPR